MCACSSADIAVHRRWFIINIGSVCSCRCAVHQLLVNFLVVPAGTWACKLKLRYAKKCTQFQIEHPNNNNMKTTSQTDSTDHTVIFCTVGRKNGRMCLLVVRRRRSSIT